MICEFYEPSLEFQENQLVRQYRRMGCDVVVVASTFDDVFDYYNGRYDPSKPARKFEDHGATIYHLPYRYNILNKIRAYTDITPILEAFCPDLIYIHDIIPNIPEVVRYRHRHPDVRIIMDIHMDYTNSGKNWLSRRILHGAIRRWFLNKVRPFLDGIFPNYPHGFKFMRDLYGVDDSEMVLLPLGCDMDYIRSIQDEQDRTAARAELGFGPNDLVVFTGGKLTARKRFELLAEAIACEELVNAHVVVAGKVPDDDSDYSALIERACKPVQDRIKFMGWQKTDDMYRLMHIADVAVFASSQSVMWQGAIGSGLPLIVGDAGGQDPSYLNQNDNVIVLHPSEVNVECLRRALITLQADPELRQRMAHGALKTGREYLDWKVLAERTLRSPRKCTSAAESRKR